VLAEATARHAHVGQREPNGAQLRLCQSPQGRGTKKVPDHRHAIWGTIKWSRVNPRAKMKRSATRTGQRSEPWFGVVVERKALQRGGVSEAGELQPHRPIAQEGSRTQSFFRPTTRERLEGDQGRLGRPPLYRGGGIVEKAADQAYNVGSLQEGWLVGLAVKSLTTSSTQDRRAQC